MKKNTELVEIAEQIKALAGRRDAIEEEIFRKESWSELKNIVGKTFVYRDNRYSCPKPGERWDVFRKALSVIGHSGHAVVIFQQCELDHYGRATLRLETEVYRDLSQLVNGAWKNCTKREYEANYKKAIAQFVTGELMAKLEGKS